MGNDEQVRGTVFRTGYGSLSKNANFGVGISGFFLGNAWEWIGITLNGLGNDEQVRVTVFRAGYGSFSKNADLGVETSGFLRKRCGLSWNNPKREGE